MVRLGWPDRLTGKPEACSTGWESNLTLLKLPLRTIIQGCCLLACGWLLAGCREAALDNADRQTPLFQGQTIRLAVPGGWGFKELWDIQLEEWAARTGARAELIEIDMTDGSGALLKSDSNLQLIIFPWTRRGELLAGKHLQSLPEESLGESQLNWDDLFRGLREKQANLDLGPALVPIGSPVLVCYYRADLLEQAGLKPPETWDDYQVLLDQLPTWAPGLTAAEPWSPEFRATLFMARALPHVKHAGHYSVYFDVDNGDPFIGTPGFVKALEVTQAAVKKLPVEVFQYDPVTCRNLVITGQAALAIGLETGPSGGPLNLAASVPARGKSVEKRKRADSISIGFCRLPGAGQVYNTTVNEWVSAEHDDQNETSNHVTLTGFAGLCAGVPRGTKPEQASAALNLLASLLLDAGTRFPTGAKSLCRESQAQDAATWVGTDLSAAEAGKYIAVVAKSLRGRQQVGELPVLGHAEFRASLTKGLTACLEQGQSPAEALRAVSTEWKEILKKLGQAEVLASYRSALGLSKREEL